jgi:4-carboxymuconolactone decarboxylase
MLAVSASSLPAGATKHMGLTGMPPLRMNSTWKQEEGRAMPRVPEISKREDLPEGQRQHYDAIMASRNRIGAPYNFLLHAPDLAARTAHLVGYSLHTSDFPDDLKELAICTVAREMDCLFEWAAHSRKAVEAGIREETVAAIASGAAPATLTGAEAEVVLYTQELLRPPHRIAPETFDALKDRLGVARLAELTGIVGAYVGLACSLNAFGVETPPGRPALPMP